MKIKIIALFLLLVFFVACEKENNNVSNYSLGLLEKPNNYNNLPTMQFPSMGMLPSSFELDMPPCSNQGQQGSCVGFAVGHSMQGYYRKHEFNMDYNLNFSLNKNAVCSPSYIYNQIKIDKCSDGSYITDALNLLKNEGVCSQEDMGYNSFSCNTLPNSIQKTKALENKLEDWKTVLINEVSIKDAIYRKYPVVIAVRLWDGFYNLDNINGHKIWKTKGSNYRGYHAMTVCGWNNTLSAFKVQNSWGQTFGDNGFVWIDYSFFDGAIVDQAYIGFNDTTNVYSNNMLTDPRDGNIYNTIIIGGKEWMTENMRYNISGSLINPSNPNIKYGRLYTYNQAINACPPGWHLPTKQEWSSLILALGGTNIGLFMKSTTGWSFNGNGTNSSGFNIFPAGNININNSNFDNLGSFAWFWTSSPHIDPFYFWIYYFSYNSDEVINGNVHENEKISCRCVKN